MFQEMKTRLVLNFYATVWPLLKEYVMLIQSKEPMAHLLNDKQEELFKQFLTCYVKQEKIVEKTGKQLKSINVSTDEGQFLWTNDMFVGDKITKIIREAHKDDKVVEEFLTRASAAYVQTGFYLTNNMLYF